MPAVKNSVKAIPLTNIASSTLTGSYQLVTAASGIPNACFLLRIINNSSTGVTISYDGVNDHDYAPTLMTIQLPVQSNAQPNNFVALFAQGTPVWVKGTAGTGNIYVAGYFQPTATV